MPHFAVVTRDCIIRLTETTGYLIRYFDTRVVVNEAYTHSESTREKRRILPTISPFEETIATLVLEPAG